MKLNIINANGERTTLLLQELERQKINDYELWPGAYSPVSVKASISLAHRQIVEYAKLAEWPCVLIAEDDFVGTHENSFKFFLSQLPQDYDLFLSQIYLGDLDSNNCVEKFTGMTMYIVHSRYYDKFLSVDPNEHIDHALSAIGGKFVVCNPFAFIQRNGWSSNTGKEEMYDSLLLNRQLYLGN